MDSFSRFKTHQKILSEQSTKNAAAEIANQVSFLRRAIGLFAKRETKLLQRIADNTDDADLFSDLSKQLEAYFPDFYSFTVANQVGVPLLKHSDFLLTKNCRRDLSSFARNFKAPVLYVHNFEAPESLHFDLMTRFKKQSGTLIPFFVSFKMSALARYIQTASVSGHKLHLVETNPQTGIRKSYLFQENDNPIIMTEKDHGFNPDTIIAQAYVQGSNWKVVNVPNPGLYASIRSALMIKAISLVTIFGAIALAMRILLIRETSQLIRTGKVISGIEKDRRRIAMDMHDQVLSDLTYLSRQCEHMHSSVNDVKSMRAHLKTSEQALEGISESIRTIIEDLHPQTLEILGLEASLQVHFKKNFSSLHEPIINFDVKPFDDNRLNDDQRLNLYRISLEIVHNIVRHANATKCNITLGMKSNSLVLSIEDDGVKFRPKNKTTKQTRGLSNIKTRAALIGSTIGWGKPFGLSAGTRFELVLPLRLAE